MAGWLRYPVWPMASFALETAPRAAPEHPSRGSAELIDWRALEAEVEALAGERTGDDRALRSALAQRLKTALIDGAVGVAVAFGGQLRIAMRLTFAGDRIAGFEAVADPDVLAKLDVKEP